MALTVKKSEEQYLELLRGDRLDYLRQASEDERVNFMAQEVINLLNATVRLEDLDVDHEALTYLLICNLMTSLCLNSEGNMHPVVVAANAATEVSQTLAEVVASGRTKH